MAADYTNGAYFGELDYYALYPDAHYFCIGEQTPEFLDELKPHYPCDDNIGLDEVIYGGITFYYPNRAYPSNSVSFEGRWYPLQPHENFDQKLLKSAGGNLSVYDSGFTDRILTVHLGVMVSEYKRWRLYILLSNICHGALWPLQIEDETGKVYTARCITPIDWDSKVWLKWNITLKFYVESVTC